MRKSSIINICVLRQLNFFLIDGVYHFYKKGFSVNMINEDFFRRKHNESY